jgi:hypothetical protein
MQYQYILSTGKIKILGLQSNEGLKMQRVTFVLLAVVLIST